MLSRYFGDTRIILKDCFFCFVFCHQFNNIASLMSLLICLEAINTQHVLFRVYVITTLESLKCTQVRSNTKICLRVCHFILYFIIIIKYSFISSVFLRYINALLTTLLFEILIFCCRGTALKPTFVVLMLITHKYTQVQAVIRAALRMTKKKLVEVIVCMRMKSWHFEKKS